MTTYYTAPTGSSSNDGSISSPWDLATALNSSAIHPGDTLWLRGGIYSGNFTSVLTGTQAAPIQVRQYPGERATLENSLTAADSPNLEIYGAYTWYREFEVANSYETRVYSDPSETVRGTGINVYAPGTKLIHLVIHDTNTALGMWSSAPDAEAYGNIISNAGIDAPDRGHGHGLYVQNATGTKLLENNIVFNNFSHGIQVYGDAALLDNVTLRNNTFFNNGDASTFGSKRNILVGGSNTANDPHLYNNYTYFSPGDGGDNNLGFTGGIYRGIVKGNTFALGDAAMTITGFANYKEISGNIFIGDLLGLEVTLYPDNTYLSTAPTSSNQVILNPDRYDPGRAHITIYNWDENDTVPVDVSGLIPSGATYQVFDCQDYYGLPILTGTYASGVINVPMNLETVSQVIGGPVTLSHTTKQFSAFILRFTPSLPDTDPRVLLFNHVDPVLAGSTLAMGETVSGTVLVQDFTIENIGLSDLDISTITLPSGFSLSSALTETSLPYAGVALFSIQFDAATSGLSSSGTVSISSNDPGSPFDFTISASTAPGNIFIIDDSDSGFIVTGTWTSFTPQGFRSGLHYASSGAGEDVATWDFTGLTPGTYKVSTTWVAFSNRATNALFEIFDGDTLLNSVSVDQQFSPIGFTDLDTTWQYLAGPYTITGSELKVKLSNDADGVVIADAIQLELMPVYINSRFVFGGYPWTGAPWTGNLETMATPPVVAPVLGIPFDSYLIMRRRRPLAITTEISEESAILLCL